MKICHIITGLGFGGAERLLVNLTNIQCKEHEVHILYLKNITNLAREFEPSIKLHFIPLGLGTITNIRTYLKSEKPDVVHTHLGHADLIGMLATTGLNVKRFCTMHNIWFKWDWKDQIIFSAYTAILKTVARNCHIIAISTSVKEHIIKRLGVAEKNTYLLYNSIPVSSPAMKSEEQARLEINIDKNNFNVLFVGRLAKQKSVDTLLKAAAKLKELIPNLKVLIVGEGDLEAELKATSKKLRLEDVVEFRGATLQPEVYFSLCDLFVLPSVFEGLGIVVLEAFRAKIPVIATNIEGPKELILPGQTGLLFTPLNHEELSENIYKLYLDDALRLKLSTEAYNSYNSNFRIEDYTQRLESLYLA